MTQKDAECVWAPGHGKPDTREPVEGQAGQSGVSVQVSSVLSCPLPGLGVGEAPTQGPTPALKQPRPTQTPSWVCLCLVGFVSE